MATRLKTCSAKDCNISRSTNPNASFFKFPRDIDRCKEWVKNSGNEKLLLVPSKRLNVRKFLCEHHFEESQFFDKFRRRLKRSAIPSIFSCTPLPDEAMSQFPVLDDSELHGSKILEKPSRRTLKSFTNKYNTFSLPFSKEPKESVSLLEELPNCSVSTPDETINEGYHTDNLTVTGTEVEVGEDDDCPPSLIKIPCEPSINGMNSVVPGTGSITYIEGPWSNSLQDGDSLKIEVISIPSDISKDYPISVICTSPENSTSFP